MTVTLALPSLKNALLVPSKRLRLLRIAKLKQLKRFEMGTKD